MTRTITDYRAGLIGEILARSAAREKARFRARNAWWRVVARWFGFCLRPNAKLCERGEGT